MFLRMIFRKIGIKENMLLLASIYGGLYAVLTFLFFWLAGLYLKQYYFTRYLLISLLVGVVMTVLYFVKWEFLKLKIKKS